MRMRDTCDLFISGSINRELVDRVLTELQKDYYQPEKLLRLVIDSPGGSIPMALTMARFLMSCFTEIHTYNLSMVDSAAVCLYLCGSKRFANSTCRFFMHPPAVEVRELQTEQQLKELLQALQTDTKSMIGFYCERTSTPRKTWERVFRNTHHMSVSDARKMDIVTDIGEVIPQFRPRVIVTATDGRPNSRINLL